MVVGSSLQAVGVLVLALDAAAGMTVRPKISTSRPGPNLEPPPREDAVAAPGPRDVVVKCYDISTPELNQAMSLLAFKPAYWFPKLSIAVGSRVWSYDGEPEQTYDAIIANAAGGPPLKTWNLGPTSMSDAEIDDVIAQMAATDYTPAEYDFFLRSPPRARTLTASRHCLPCVGSCLTFVTAMRHAPRNCNHFCYDLSERLTGESGWSADDAVFIDERVLHESEAILNSMPGGAFQQSMTRTVTRQVQKIIVKSWRKEWKRALAEYEVEQNIPVEQRIR